MSAPETEYKFLPAGECGLSLKSDEGRPVAVHGYASTFMGEPDSYGDLIAPGAYARTIKGWRGKGLPLPFLLEHDGAPIGKWVELREDDKGLWVEGELTPGHSVAGDVAASLKHGALSGLSIGYRCKKFTLDHQAKTRILEDIDLYEVSAVANPANETARIAAVKAAHRAAEEEAVDLPAVVKAVENARVALAERLRAGGLIQQPDLYGAVLGAEFWCGQALDALNRKSPRAMPFTELRKHFMGELGLSRGAAEQMAEIAIKARDAGGGVFPGAGESGPTGGTDPGAGVLGTDLLAAIRAVSVPTPSWASPR